MLYNVELIKDISGTHLQGLAVVAHQHKGDLLLVRGESYLHGCDLQIKYGNSQFLLLENRGPDGQSVQITRAQWRDPFGNKTQHDDNLKDFLEEFGYPIMIDVSGLSDLQSLIGREILGARAICYGIAELGVMVQLQQAHLFYWVDGDEGFFGWSDQPRWILDRGYELGRSLNDSLAK